MDKQGKIRIFLVEDQPIVRVGLRATLENFPDLEVVGEVGDGKTAVEKVLHLRPDVTIMDIGLPEIDGVEATRQIKTSWSEALVLMLSSHENEQQILASLTAGADGYCLKTVSAEQLALAINLLLKGTVWLDPGIARRVLTHQFSQNKDTRGPSRKERGKFDLSDREVEVLKLLVDGMTNHQMAERLYLSNETIKTHMRHIMEKLSVSDRTQAAVKAMRQGLVG
jgi:two-component system, NarL family, response regulator LiaR